MGGIFSGRKPSKTAKPFPEQFVALNIRELQEHAGLEPGRAYSQHKHRRGKEYGVFSVVVYEDYLELGYCARNHQGPRFPTQMINLTRTPCNFGGYRPWFICPGDQCGRRVAILYGPHSMLCRHCWGIAYQSQRETKLQRLFRKLESLEAIFPDAPIAKYHESLSRPKGMHHRTFNLLGKRHRLLASEIRLRQVEELIELDAKFEARLSRIESR
ncbi:hypothetical protein MTMN5_03549 [Marinobacter salarius]|nr:hypothetical protein MTMN5_03549 [Marinobacter salarius]